ncbi:radical SAM protein [Microbacterium oxydans]|nr:radical SAM protein [Microbacterium oxydans]
MNPIEASLYTRGPLRAVIDLNETCNLKCDYCHVNAGFIPKDGVGPTLPQAHFRSILDELSEMGTFEVTLTGGEVTTMKDFHEYLDIVADYPHLTFQIITNGTLLMPKMLNHIVGSGVRRISLSLDGAEAANDKHRGQGSWTRAVRGMRAAIESGITVNIISVLTKDNFREWRSFVTDMKALGASSIDLSPMCQLGRAQSLDSAALDLQDLQWLESGFRAYQDDLPEKSTSVRLNLGSTRVGQWDGEPAPIHIVQDMYPGTQIVFRLSGTTTSNRIIGKSQVLGNHYTSSVREMWSSSHSDRLASFLNAQQDASQNLTSYYGISVLAPERVIDAELQALSTPADGSAEINWNADEYLISAGIERNVNNR